MSTKRHRSHVFISYNHNDARWVDRLRVHLKPLEKQYGIVVWDYQQIRPGAKWQEETERSIDCARVAILLVSADFLASDFIANDELPRLLQAAETDGTTILPIIVSPSSFSQTNLAKFQTVNDPTKPLTGLPVADQESVFLKVKLEVERSFTEPSQQTRRLSFKSGPFIAALLIALSILVVAIIKFGVPAVDGTTQTATSTPQPTVQAKSELSGTVVDRNEKPLQGARVTLDDVPGMSPVETSSDGVFNLRNIPKEYGDGVRVRVVMEGYHPNPYTEDVVLGKAPPIIKLTKVR